LATEIVVCMKYCGYGCQTASIANQDREAELFRIFHGVKARRNLSGGCPVRASRVTSLPSITRGHAYELDAGNCRNR
jgi:hypothetical protein